jgi:putative ABC transport system ATP-binding protein
MINNHRSLNITKSPILQPEDKPIIDLRRVTKRYDSPAGSFTALDDIDLQVEKGEFVGIVGKSGSGKSTLLNILAGIDRASAGEVTVAGTAVHALSQNRSAIWRGQTVGVIFQFFQLLPTLTILPANAKNGHCTS